MEDSGGLTAISIHPTFRKMWFPCNISATLALGQKCSTYPHKLYKNKVSKIRTQGSFSLKLEKVRADTLPCAGHLLFRARVRLLRVRAAKQRTRAQPSWLVFELLSQDMLKTSSQTLKTSGYVSYFYQSVPFLKLKLITFWNAKTQAQIPRAITETMSLHVTWPLEKLCCVLTRVGKAKNVWMLLRK